MIIVMAAAAALRRRVQHVLVAVATGSSVPPPSCRGFAASMAAMMHRPAHPRTPAGWAGFFSLTFRRRAGLPISPTCCSGHRSCSVR